MATRVGTGVSGTVDAAAGSIPAGPKDTTGAHALFASIKWEVSGVTLSSVTDSKGNAWTIILQVAHGTGGEPHQAIAVCLNPINDASLVVTANFSATTATFRRIQVEAFASSTGLFAVDGVGKSGTGTASPYSTSSLTTTGAGVVFAGVGDFNALAGITATGTPTFTLGPTTGDSFAEFLLSSSAQTVTPGATSSSGATRWVMVAGAIVEVASGGLVRQPQLFQSRVGTYQQAPRLTRPLGIVTSSAVTTITATPGTWSWAGTTATTSQLINATPGTWSWAGTTGTTSQLINAAVGAYTWAGTTATTSQLINATPGAWSWAGTTGTTSQLINASPGTWSWAGTTANLDGAIGATPGTYTWAGTTATTSQLINGAPGTWSWAGTTATTSQLINATPGTWSWAGTTAATSQLINASVGAWSWSGTTAATSQLINATPGTWTWAGLTATTNPVISAIVGAWSWSGTTSALVQSVTVDASPATYTWAGTTATVVQTTDVVGSGGKGKKRKQANTGPSYADEFKDELARLREAEALRERIAQEDEEILALVAGFVSVITR